MPSENTDTNRSVSEQDDSLFNSLQSTEGKISEPTVPDPDDPRYKYANLVKGLIPKYAFHSSDWVLSRLNEDETFRSQLTDSLVSYQVENDQNFRQWWENEETPEEGTGSKKEYVTKLKKNILDQSSKNAYNGKGVKNSVIDHTFKLSKKNDVHGIQNPTSLIQKYTQDYESWFEKDDIKGNNIPEETINSLYENDDDFRKQLIRNQLDEFEGALGTKANQGVFNASENPFEYEKAFAVFNRFGSEALTDYTNILQHYVPGEAAQDSRVVSAFRRFAKSPQYKDENPLRYAQEVVGGKKGLNFEPENPLKKYESTIQKAAEENEIDPTLLAGIFMQESVLASLNTGDDLETIKSHKGARGIGQLMPETARDLGLVVNDEIDERTDPIKNIEASARYFGQMLKSFDGDSTLALAAYNAGPTAARGMIIKAKEQGAKDITGVLGNGYYDETANYIPAIKGIQQEIAKNATTEIDEFEVVPQRKIDQKPKDWNPFTERFKYAPEQTAAKTHQEGLVRQLNALTDWVSNGDYPDFVLGVPEDQMEGDAPLDLHRALRLQQLRLENEGWGDDSIRMDYPDLAYEIVDKSLRAKEGEPSFEDLVATLAANHDTFELNAAGEPVYTLSYENLNRPENQSLRLIVDGMITHSAGDQVMSKIGDNIVIEPEKATRRGRERVTENLSGWLYKRQMKDRLILDESGMVAGIEKHLPNNIGTVIDGIGVGMSDIVPEMYGGVIGGWMGRLAETQAAGWVLDETGIGQDNAIEFFDRQRHKARDYYSGTLEQFTDPVASAGGIEFSAPDIGTAGGTLIGYLTGIKALGKGMVWASGKALGKAAGTASKLEQVLGKATGLKRGFEAVSGQRKYVNLKEFYALANRSKSGAATALSKARQFMTGTQRAILNNSAYGTWPTFVIGSAGIETATDPQFSLASFVDFAIQDAVLGLKEEDKWDIDKTYRTSGALGRWAMDWLGGEVLGIFFDGAIGVSKMMNDYSLRALRGKPRLGLEYDHATGKYKPEAESRYMMESDSPFTGARKYTFPEIQRFVFNVMNNVNDIPLGDIKKSAAKYARMKSPGAHFYAEGEEATQADIVAKFVSDANEFMGTARDDLRQIIGDANEKYGGKARLSEEQVDILTKSIYDEFLDTSAKQIFSFTGKGKGYARPPLKGADVPSPESLQFPIITKPFTASTVADLLERHPAALSDVTPISLKGTANLDRTEATIAQKQNPGSYVIPVGKVDGKETFRVFKQDPALWRYDLAQRLRQYDSKINNMDQTVDEHVAKFGLDINREDDVDDIATIINTLENTEGVGFRYQDKEGVITGFEPEGWRVAWDDGTDEVYSKIRGLDDVDESPPKIRSRIDTGEEARGTGEFDERGIEIEEGEAEARAPQSDEVEELGRVLDLRTPERVMEEVNARGSAEARAARQQELEEVFADPEERVSSRITRIQQLMDEGKYDEAEQVVREIAEIRRGPDSSETIELPGVTRLSNILEYDRQVNDMYRLYGQSEPTDLGRIFEYHADRLKSAVRGGDLDNAPSDIASLRAMGMTKDEVNNIIDENFVGDIKKQQFLRNYNESIDFGEGVRDELIRARVDAKRLAKIKDEAFQALPDKVKNQMVSQAELLFGMRSVDEPQRLIDEADPEATGFRSWEGANEQFKPARPNTEKLSGREYSIRLAEDLGVANSRDIAKLQKTRSGASEKVPIRSVDEEMLFDKEGNVIGIKNSKGLVVRVDPINGDLPFYAIGRKNNVKSHPTRFIADQNGKLSYNQEWAFINENVTRQVDGSLRRFNIMELPNGEMAYIEARSGKYVLNVQNPVRVRLDEYIGGTVRTTGGGSQAIRGKRTDQILTPERIFRENVDAIETIEPRTGRKIYKVVSPEDQALLHKKPVSSPGDQRTPHVLFEVNKMPLNAVEAMQRFSKVEPKAGGKSGADKLHAFAWLAIPGLTLTGNVGYDEHGDLTPFGKAALGLGILGVGGLMVRSMSAQFKIRNAYDALEPKYKNIFDRFDWTDNVDAQGNIRQELLTDDESAMLNRLKGVPKDDYALLHNLTFKNEDINVRGEDIPTLRGDIGEFDSSSFVRYTANFEDGKIYPKHGANSVEVEGNQSVISLELDATSSGLVTKNAPTHQFLELREAEGLGPKAYFPVSWARTQLAPDGKLVLDELQVDNALQKGMYGDTGDLNRDLYNIVLDEFVTKALKEGDGSFYISRGDMQGVRYGDNPDAVAVHKRTRQRIIEEMNKIREANPGVVIRDAQTIERAQRLKELSQRDPAITTQTKPVFDELMDPRQELGRAINTFMDQDIDPSSVMRMLADPENARSSSLSIKEIEDGFRLELSEKSLEYRATRAVYDSDELLQRSFPSSSDLMTFVNDGPPTRGLVAFYDHTLPNILKKRYGAEFIPAKGPGKPVYDSLDEAFHQVKIHPSGLDRAKGKTGKRLQWESIPGYAGLTGLALAAYNLESIDSRQPPEEELETTQAGLGALSMILLGAAALGASKRFRTKIGANVKGTLNKSLKNSIDGVSAKGIEYDGKRFEYRELHELDVTYSPGDPQSIARNQKMLSGLKSAIKGGSHVRDWFRNSSYTQAGSQLLKHISEGLKNANNTRKATLADKINELIINEHGAASRYRRLATNHFNTTLGYGDGAFQEFPAKRAAEVVNKFADSPIDPTTARQLFDQTVNIMLDRGIKKVNGVGVIDKNVPPHIRQVYESETGELFQKLTRDLLQQEDVVDWVTSLKKGYQEVERAYLPLLTNELTRRVMRLRQQPLPGDSYLIGDSQFTHNDVMSLVDRWTRSKDVKTYNEFVKTLEPDERHLLRIAKRSSVFKDIMEMQHARRRFTDLKGKYNPQVVDHNKMGTIRQRYIDMAKRDPSVMDGMHHKDPETWARLQMMEDFRQINDAGDGRGLLGFDEERLNLEGKSFSTADDAQVRLMAIINDGSPTGVQDAFDEFMGTTRITPEALENAGFIVRDVNIDGETVFRLRQPDRFTPEYEGVKYGLFDGENSKQFSGYYDRVMRDPALKRSNFLENPRNYNMPMAWLKSNPVERWRLYTEDVGPRLHALKYGLFNAQDFDTNYKRPLGIAMQNAGFDDEFIAKSIGRVDEIFKNQWGIIKGLSGKTGQEAEQFLKGERAKNSFLQTYRNMDYMKRTYGFGYLNFFQTALTSMPMTSWRAFKEAWGMGGDGLNIAASKQFENLLMDAHIIKEKDLTFRFDIQPNDLTGEHGTFLDKAQRATQAGADGISDFSFKRSALELLGLDPGSNRGVRMITDSFHGTNVMNTTHNGYMFMSEASHFARIGKEMKDANVPIDGTFKASDGKVYNWQTVYDKLENLGVSKTKNVTTTDANGNRITMKEADYFIQEESQLRNFISRLKNNDRVALSDFDPKYADIVERQLHFATESYHGTNKAMRPEKWNTPLGRTLSMYASFTFNTAMQTVRQRTLNPMNNWLNRFSPISEDGVRQISKIQMPLLMKHVRTGNLEALRKLGIQDPKRAIAEFPIDAIDNMWRITAGIGFSVAQYTTLGIMMDLYAWPVIAALGGDEDDQWKQTRNYIFNDIINPYAPESEQVTLSEIFGGEAEAADIAKLLGWGLGKLSQSSYGGMYLSPFDSINKYGFNGITSLSPATGIGDRFISDIAGLLKPIGTLNLDELPPEFAKFAINNMPVLSSNVFVEQRRALRGKVNEYIDEIREEDERSSRESRILR